MVHRVAAAGRVLVGWGRRQDQPAFFFTKGGPTERVWYYDLSDIKVTKKQPLTVDRFEGFFALLPTRGDSDHSWTVTRDEIEVRRFDLKAVNPNARSTEDTRTRKNSSTSSSRRAGRWTRQSGNCAGYWMPNGADKNFGVPSPV